MSIIRLARAATLALTLALGTSACDGSSRSTARAETSSDARRLVAAGATLLDVRTPGEYAGGHIEGALNVPLDTVASRLAEIPRDRPVVVYCHSGGRSARAADALRASGYTVHDLGPMAAW